MGALMLLSLVVQRTLNSRFEKYSEEAVQLSGAEVAQRMLAAHGIRDVQITSIDGKLSDHYNPQTRTVNLSRAVYYGRNVAAAAVAAHECGHVLQHASGYFPLRMRSALVPVVTFSNNVVSWVLLAGLLLINVFPELLWAGIALFALSTLFSFITLPVEINASARAIKWLEETGVTTYETKDMASDALRWAAYTYVIAALGSLASLLYYLSFASRRS